MNEKRFTPGLKFPLYRSQDVVQSWQDNLEMIDRICKIKTRGLKNNAAACK